MGSLEMIIGPMFSGKTNLLIDKYNMYNLISQSNNDILSKISNTFCMAFNYVFSISGIFMIIKCHTKCI